MRYPCSQCEYIATQAWSAPKVHVQNKHGGVSYPCSQCEYAATHASNLKKHVKSKHDGVRYPSTECE